MCVVIIILFIVQCWTYASKPEPLKQANNVKNKNKIHLYSTKNKHLTMLKQTKKSLISLNLFA